MATIFSKNVLFIHVQKNGGTSVSKYLMQVLPRPVFYLRPEPYAWLNDDRAVHIPGHPHISMNRAKSLLQSNGFSLKNIPIVLAVMRNPYDRAVSLYSFYRRTELEKNSSSVKRLAWKLDFREFILEATSNPAYDFMSGFYACFHLGKVKPRNLRIIKYEHLEDEVKSVMAELNIRSNIQFPWLNQSQRGEYESYYDAQTEEAVYFKNRWVFDEGFYTRMWVDV
jgi:hypothetical protein